MKRTAALLAAAFAASATPALSAPLSFVPDDVWRGRPGVQTYADDRTAWTAIGITVEDEPGVTHQERRWFMVPGAEDPAQERFERPLSDPEEIIGGRQSYYRYFEFADITAGWFYDDASAGVAYFGIDLEGDKMAWGVDEVGIGFDATYGVRFATNADLTGGGLIRLAGYPNSIDPDPWADQHANVTGYFDTNGIAGDGYETAFGAENEFIAGRSDRNFIELALDYRGLGLDASDLAYLLFEAAISPPDPGDYPWGNQVAIGDTLRTVPPVPVPPGLPLMTAALAMLGWLRWKKPRPVRR